MLKDFLFLLLLVIGWVLYGIFAKRLIEADQAFGFQFMVPIVIPTFIGFAWGATALVSNILRRTIKTLDKAVDRRLFYVAAILTLITPVILFLLPIITSIVTVVAEQAK